ncbi:MAG: hypothetical protein EOO29_29400, partial [Comamonadaceae bacterium]
FQQAPPLADWTRGAAVVVMVAGLLAALLGAFGLWRVRAAGQRAMRSRDDLLHAFTQWRRHLPRYLGLLLLVLAAGFAALTFVRGFATYDAATHGASKGALKGQFALLIFAALFAWGAVTALWRLRRSLEVLDTEPMAVLGRALTQEQAPALWRYVADLAERVGARQPQHIVLGIEDSFYVTASDVVVQPAQQRLEGQTLHLPLTFLTLLRRDEIDAIVGHELGHFVGDDTAYSLRFAPLYSGMVDALQRVDGDEFEWGNAPAVSFGNYLLDRFDRAVKHWSRVRELEADRVGASVAGAEASARALVRVTALSHVVHAQVAEIARRPDEAGHDLISRLVEAARAQPLVEPNFAVEVATAHPYDTHPPTLERLQALGQALSPVFLDDALAPPGADSVAWARGLFADSESLQLQLLEDFKATSRERNEETRQVLTSVASRAADVVEINDGRLMLWLFGGAAAFLLLLTVLVAVRILGSGEPALFLGLLGGSAICGVMAWWAYKRSMRMTMALTPDGMIFPGMAAPVSWGHVQDYTASENYGNVALLFTLTPDAPPMLLAHSNYRRLSYSPKKGRIAVNLFGVRGMKTEAFYERLGEYLNGWHARQALESM